MAKGKKPTGKKPKVRETQPTVTASGAWVCRKCTAFNKRTDRVCYICKTKR